MNEIPQPYRDELFYFALRDRLNVLQKGKRWNWAEVRCDIVVSDNLARSLRPRMLNSPFPGWFLTPQ